MDLDLMLCCEKRPGRIESLALLPATRGQDRLCTSAPAHAAELETLRHERLARRLDDARANRKPARLELGVLHPMPMLAEVRRAEPNVGTLR